METVISCNRSWGGCCCSRDASLDGVYVLFLIHSCFVALRKKCKSLAQSLSRSCREVCLTPFLPPTPNNSCLCLFLYASVVSPDARRWVSSAGSVGVGRGFQHRGRPALSRLTTHDLPCDWHQKPLLRPLPEVHANRAVWNRGDTRRDSRDHRWVHYNTVTGPLHCVARLQAEGCFIVCLMITRRHSIRFFSNESYKWYRAPSSVLTADTQMDSLLSSWLHFIDFFVSKMQRGLL